MAKVDLNRVITLYICMGENLRASRFSVFGHDGCCLDSDRKFVIVEIGVLVVDVG